MGGSRNKDGFADLLIEKSLDAMSKDERAEFDYLVNALQHPKLADPQTDQGKELRRRAVKRIGELMANGAGRLANEADRLTVVEQGVKEPSDETTFNAVGAMPPPSGTEWSGRTVAQLVAVLGLIALGLGLWAAYSIPPAPVASATATPSSPQVETIGKSYLGATDLP